MSRQDADGTPHISYFDKETTLGFAWDGKSDVVEVTLGGIGEPVIDSYEARNHGTTIESLFANFEYRCLQYVSMWTAMREVFDRANTGWVRMTGDNDRPALPAEQEDHNAPLG